MGSRRDGLFEIVETKGKTMKTTSVELKQTRLAENTQAVERWERRLFRAVSELRKLRDQRKRLLKPKAVFAPQSAAGETLNDAIPDFKTPIGSPKAHAEELRERKRERDRRRRRRKKELAAISDITNLTRSEVGI
jgi:Rad3-related DNA helicase